MKIKSQQRYLSLELQLNQNTADAQGSAQQQHLLTTEAGCCICHDSHHTGMGQTYKINADVPEIDRSVER